MPIAEATLEILEVYRPLVRDEMFEARKEVYGKKARPECISPTLY